MKLEVIAEWDVKKFARQAALVTSLGTSLGASHKPKPAPRPTTQAAPTTKPTTQPTTAKVYKDTLKSEFGPEFDTVEAAARRNNCTGELFYILLAIRKAEDGPAGREFGVLAKGAIDTNLDTQAGWAASTIVKNYSRWQASGSKGDFITHLGSVYCPTKPAKGKKLRPAEKDLNKHWITNVTSFARKFKSLDN